MLLGDEDLDIPTIKRVTEMFVGNERWFHPLGMSCSLASMRCIKGKEYCSIVTSIAQNGVETGIKVAGLGEQWFKGPAPRFVGTLFSTQWTLDDAVPYMGDSTATESYGMGAFSAAAAPTVLRLRNGGWREARAQSEELRTICAGRNNNFRYRCSTSRVRGSALTSSRWSRAASLLCHGGIVNKTGGQIGAGAARYGTEHYVSAAYAFLDKYGNK
ncbi:MAG: DUF1116 domain-containing protein [Lachnospiraceae bacterium]